MLTEHVLDVQDYIEIHPAAMEKSEASLWAKDGLYIGCLVYRNGTLRTTVIAEGFRQPGHGSEFTTTWFEQNDDDTLTVLLRTSSCISNNSNNTVRTSAKKLIKSLEASGKIPEKEINKARSQFD